MCPGLKGVVTSNLNGRAYRKPKEQGRCVPAQGSLQSPQGPACQVYRAHALGLQARCRAAAGGEVEAQSAPSAPPEPAAHTAMRAAVPPPHFALQLPHGSYSHCAPLQASVLQHRHLCWDPTAPHPSAQC